MRYVDEQCTQNVPGFEEWPATDGYMIPRVPTAREMMNKDRIWKNNSSGTLMQYDFSPPRYWTDDRIKEVQLAFASQIEDANGVVTPSVPGWLHLVQRLPEGIRMALVAELRAGNRLSSIGATGWPNDDSIVINMRERFSATRTQPPPGVVWRAINDPRYCREELSERADAVDFLIIA